LEAQVAEAEARCSRLVKALGAGGELESLVAGLKTAQEEKDEAKAALAAMPPVPEQIDTEAITAALRAYSADMVSLLSDEQGPKMRALLRKLIPAPLVAEATTDEDGRRCYRLRGEISLLGIVDGNVTEMLSHAKPQTGGGPNGKPISLEFDLGAFALAGEAAA